MSFEDDRATIQQYFIDNLTGVALRFEGYNYLNQTPPFVGVIINPLTRVNATIDSTSQVVDGFIRVRLFTKIDAGTKELMDLCDQVSTMIDNKQFSTVGTYAAGAPTEIDTEDAYLAKEISIPYYSDN